MCMWQSLWILIDCLSYPSTRTKWAGISARNYSAVQQPFDSCNKLWRITLVFLLIKIVLPAREVVKREASIIASLRLHCSFYNVNNSILEIQGRYNSRASIFNEAFIESYITKLLQYCSRYYKQVVEMINYTELNYIIVAILAGAISRMLCIGLIHCSQQTRTKCELYN